MSRKLYLISYDISEPKRLYRIFRLIKNQAIEGQKSSYTCWLTKPEKEQLKSRLKRQIDPEQDRLHIIALDPRQAIKRYGKAKKTEYQPFLIL